MAIGLDCQYDSLKSLSLSLYSSVVANKRRVDCLPKLLTASLKIGGNIDLQR